MTLKEKIMKLQTYKMFVGEDTVYVERDDVLKLLEQEPCEDCVSRKAALEKAKSYNTDGWDMYTPLVVDVEDIEELPPVIPISPKGHWREVDTNMYACSKCSHVLTIDPLDNSILEMNTCPFCSAKMEGVVEEI